MTTKLTFPAPRRCAISVGERVEHLGKKKTLITHTWADREWTEADVIEAKQAGAIFVRGKHDFADDAAECAALGRVSKKGGDFRSWLKKLGPRELNILREELRKEVES